jgi:hypothetical protein
LHWVHIEDTHEKEQPISQLTSFIEPPTVTTAVARSNAWTSNLLCAAYAGGSAQFVGNVVPFLLGAISERYAATPVQLGLVNSCYAGVSLVVGAAAPAWIRRFSWRAVSGLSAVGAIATFVLASLAPDMLAIYGVFVLAGLFSALLGAPSNAVLGFSSFPGRWFGISMVFQMAVAAIFALTVPAHLQAKFGAAGAFAAMAATFLPCIAAAWLIPRGASSYAAAVTEEAADAQKAPDSLLQRPWGPLIAAFTAAVLFTGAANAYWIFVERIGAQAHITPAFIGFSVAISNVTGVVGAIAVVWAARRLRALLIGGLLAGIVGYALMVVPSPQHFLISVCLYNFAWGIALPIFLTLIRAVDFTNRLFVAGSATVFLPAVIIGPLAGALAEQSGYQSVIYVCGGLCAASLLLGLYVYSVATKRAGAHLVPTMGPH